MVREENLTLMAFDNGRIVSPENRKPGCKDRIRTQSRLHLCLQHHPLTKILDLENVLT